MWYCLKRFHDVPNDRAKYDTYVWASMQSLERAMPYLQRLALSKTGEVHVQTSSHDGVVSVWFVTESRLNIETTVDQMRRLIHARGRVDDISRGPGQKLDLKEQLATTSAMTTRELQTTKKLADRQRKTRRGKRM